MKTKNIETQPDVVEVASKKLSRAAKKAAKAAAKTNKKLDKQAAKAERKMSKKNKGVKVADVVAEAPAKPKKKGRAFVTLLTIGAIAGVGYVIYKKTQPQEDPWVKATSGSDQPSPFADMASDAQEAADAAVDKAESIVDDAAPKNI